MKSLVIMCICIFYSLQMQAQDRHVHFVVMINNKVPTPAYVQVLLVTKGYDKSVDTTAAKYLPGDLSFDQATYQKIENLTIQKTSLVLKYFDEGGTGHRFEYEISLPKDWVKGTYFIVEIQNLNSKKERGHVDSYVYKVTSDLYESVAPPMKLKRANQAVPE